MADSHIYDDIINLPRSVSPRRIPMTRLNRAAQFAPFAALTGFEGSIRETARLTDCKAELDENAAEILNLKLTIINDTINLKPEVGVTYFVPDERKPGGAYITAFGAVKRFDEYQRVIIMEDGTQIRVDDIFDISGAAVELVEEISD